MRNRAVFAARPFFEALADVAARAAFDRRRFYCVNANCSWQGTGRTVETVDIDGDGRSTDYPHCPRCGADVDGDDVTPGSGEVGR